MKKRRASRPAAVESAGARTAAAPVKQGWKLWHWAAIALASLLVVFEVYSGALAGPFLLDDLYLPFGLPGAEQVAMEMWLSRRPALMATFLLNFKMSGQEPYSYHVFNVVLHWVTSVLVFLLFRKLLGMVGEEGRRRDLLAMAGAAVFLLHPMQTESVAYIASRSDVLCTLFSFTALLVFLHYRGAGIGVIGSLAVLALFALGVLSKEQAAALPAVFVVADLLWPGETRFRALGKNWKLYAPMIVGGVLGVFVVRQTLRFADTAGFNIKGLTPWDYFLTQCRVIWMYIRMIVLPFGLNIDHDIPVSHGLFDHGAAFGLVALLAAAGAAWRFRRQYPLVLFGLLAALIFLGPTSSFLPIRDVAAERRMYAPLFGFVLIGLDLMRRVAERRAAIVGAAAALCVLAVTTHSRAALYGSDVEIWADSAAKSPNKVRPGFQLAYAHYKGGKCPEAAREYSRIAQLEKPDTRLLIDWALALDCAGRSDEAMAKLKDATALERTAHPYALLGMIHGKAGRAEEALAALETAERLEPSFAMTYVYRGNVYATRGDWVKAVEQYRRAVQLEPWNQAAFRALQMAEPRLRQR